MKIEHSRQLNDFLTFYIETKIDGILKYETIIDYFTGEYEIINLENAYSFKYHFDLKKDEWSIEKEIKSKVEKLIRESSLL